MFYNINFLLPNTYDSFFYKIINNTDLCSEFFYFEGTEIITENLKELDLDNKVYSYGEIKDVLSQKQYIVFLKCSIFSKRNNPSDRYPSSLDEFLKSQINTMVFIADVQFVNVITKDKLIYKQVLSNASNHNFSDLTVHINSIGDNFFDFK